MEFANFKAFSFSDTTPTTFPLVSKVDHRCFRVGDLTLIPCSCRPGTEGTPRCIYGRACGVFTAAGNDVGAILISEGLARSDVCGRTSCPLRKPWCD
jgi:hypothetical protein